MSNKRCSSHSYHSRHYTDLGSHVPGTKDEIYIYTHTYIHTYTFYYITKSHSPIALLRNFLMRVFPTNDFVKR